jgi:serine/threonine protein kinase
LAPRERALSVVGSLAYMAPEVSAGGGGGGLAADVWSFGVLAHELLLGASPFSARALGACNEEDEGESAAAIARRASAAEIDEPALAARAGSAAAALVRAALSPCAQLRPCVHALMRHRFFAEAEGEAGPEEPGEAGGGGGGKGAVRYFAG